VFCPADLGQAVLLMEKYADTPMDFADATLILLADVRKTRQICTLDRRGFTTFRALGWQSVHHWSRKHEHVDDPTNSRALVLLDVRFGDDSEFGFTFLQAQKTGYPNRATPLMIRGQPIPQLSNECQNFCADVRQFFGGYSALLPCLPTTPVQAFHLIGQGPQSPACRR